ncbi:MAG: branched-chain amino acid transporter permease [Lachnospiraceae bacterium]|nr:branched-chain amino acid transporter permease [Lachnospiraceae bacterium]
MNKIHSAVLVLIIALVTMALRFLPFLFFGGKRKTPAFITYLSQVLPFAIIGMLVVYCLKQVDVTAAPYGLPELLGCGAVAGLHWWKKNTLLSIGAGTVIYMVLIQMVF